MSHAPAVAALRIDRYIYRYGTLLLLFLFLSTYYYLLASPFTRTHKKASQMPVEITDAL
ncbi:MAG: Cbb3-type cytochrome oxidase [Podoviridae sp. ctKoA10]|nr:MAG: Cbb3-type cytochrome oxidase [Podoviridae sp. ctKoA10]